MPIYDYDCSECGHSFELRKGWSDDLSAQCELCDANANKRFAAPTIIYKGGGFYTTDYANQNRPSAVSRKTPQNGADKPKDNAKEKAGTSESNKQDSNK